MARAKSKPLSFSTTMRNPNRIAGFLSQIVEFEGQVLTSEVIYKIIHNVIKNKLYYHCVLLLNFWAQEYLFF